MGPIEHLNVWLDDLCDDVTTDRATPTGWIGVKTPQEAINLLKTNTIEVISFDNDLGLSGYDGMTEGRHVLDWLEAALVVGIVTKVPTMYAHTSNVSAKLYMHKLIRKIYAWRDARDGHES